MAYRYEGTDLDDLLAPLGETAKRADVGYLNDGVDISNRYMASTGGDTLAYPLGYLSDGVDIATMFRAKDYEPAVAPVITAQPSGGTLNEGDVAVLGITATGTPTPSYQWRRNGVNVAGATSSTYIFATSRSDNGVAFSCYVSNTAGNVTSTSVYLTVQYTPSILVQPQSQAITAGSSTAMVLAAIGVPSPSYQWRLNGSNISDGPNYGNTNASTLLIYNASALQAGTYTCAVFNTRGTVVSSSAVLTVGQIATQANYSPVSGTTWNYGNSLSVQLASHNGTTPATYRWFYWNGAGYANSGTTSSVLNLGDGPYLGTPDDLGGGLYEYCYTIEITNVFGANGLGAGYGQPNLFEWSIKVQS